MQFERVSSESQPLSQARLEALRRVIPECFVETRSADGELVRRVDFDALREALGEGIAEAGRERYGFYWVGKQAAKRAASEPVRGTLRPCPEESADWDTTQNLYIEGDNLEVLKLLQRAYLGRVKMIYIDPPYNTGHDFVYRDDFAVSRGEYARAAGHVDGEGNRLRENRDGSPRFHSDWCSMIYSRLLVARSLLADDGVIFISIDDNEISNLRKICDEVFWDSNLIAEFIWKKKQGGGNDSSMVVTEHEYILAFSKDVGHASLNVDLKYKLDDGLYPFRDDAGAYGLVTLDKSSIQFSASLVFEIQDPQGNVYTPRVVKGKQSCWRWSKAKVQSEYDKLVFRNGKVYTKYYRPRGVTPRSLLVDSCYGRTETGHDDIKALFGHAPFSYPKPVSLIEHLLQIGTSSDSLVLDFFSGSATTAHAVMSLNAADGGHRRFICVQLPEATPPGSVAHQAGYASICEIGKERIRRAGRQIRAAEGNRGKALDTGFRVLKVDSPNEAEVLTRPAALTQAQLYGQVPLLKPGRSDLDLLFGCMLSWGVPLSVPYRTEMVDGHRLHIVNGRDLVACFGQGLTLRVVARIASCAPLRVVLRDGSFARDADKVDLYERFKQLCGWTDEEARRRIHVI